MDGARAWSQYYLKYLGQLGLMKFSLIIAGIMLVLMMLLQLGLSMMMTGGLEVEALLRSLFFGLLVSPWLIFMLSVVIEELEDSRQRLRRMVHKLQQMRERDQQLNETLQRNLLLLNAEFERRSQAVEEKRKAIRKLEDEVYQREQTQLELQKQTALLRSFIDSSPDLVYFRTEEGRFSGCNRAVEELVGRSEQELIGLTPYDVYSEEVAKEVLKTDEEVFRTNQPLTYEQVFKYPDGRAVYIEMRKVPFFDHSGKRLGLLGFGRDIGEHKRTQEALRKASRDKTSFISTISHELKTPLNGIMGLARIMLDTRLDNEQQKYMKTILLSAETLGNIFNDIIDMDKFDRRRFEMNVHPLNFRDFADDIKILSKLQAEQKQLALEFESYGELPEYLLADGTRLRQVLWNLINNAIKFTEQGQVSVRLFVSDEGDNLVGLTFEVEDTGIGIPDDIQDKIFEMYYQHSGSQSARGTGIGLAITRDLVNAMGGEIWVSSDVGVGSSFTVELEFETCASPEPQPTVTVDSLLILLVEDVELNITVARMLLEKMGHRVEVAMDGTTALEMAGKQHYDLMLLDIQLPDMTGFDIARILRERDTQGELPPLVALTANVIQDEAEYLLQGMDAVISKPLKLSAMEQVLKQFFSVVESEPREEPMKKMTDSHEGVLDHELLGQYIEDLGPDIMLSSVKLFEDKVPEYVEIMMTHLAAREQDGIVEEAHKIKGAAGSIGLQRVQQLAQQIQSPELATWWENVDEWVEKLLALMPGDIELLKGWIKQQMK